MRWRFMFTVSAIFFFGFTGVQGDTSSSISEKSSNANLRSLIPLDPSIVMTLYNTLPEVSQKFTKLQNRSDGIVKGMLTQGGQLAVERFSPKNINESDVFFYLYNKKRRISEPISLQNISKPDGKLFVVVHGWVEDAIDANWYKELAESLLGSFRTSQVILVDWGSSANTFIYSLAVRRTKTVGAFIANRISELVETKNVPLEDLVLIGFDLGAHVCGIAGQSFLQATKKTLPLIIGLDPSRRLFEGIDIRERLDETDAKIVMVVHTDTSMFGYNSNCGSIDFYPNGGSSQPGCKFSNIFCNHRRSYEIFISAVSNPKKFPTMQCNNYEEYKDGKCLESKVFFGNIAETQTGSYYFATTGGRPFYKTFIDKMNPLKWG